MAETAGSPAKAIQTYLVIYISAVVSQHINYALGCKSRTVREQYSSRKVWRLFISTFWHPQLAAVSVYSVGTKRDITYWRFLIPFFCTSLFWSISWALVLYRFGNMLTNPSVFSILVVVYLLAWTGKCVISEYRALTHE